MELKSYFAQDSQGNVLPGATCRVYLAGTETLADSLRDANNEPKANPFNAASNGLIQFAAPNGVYDLAVSSGGANYTLRVQCNDLGDSIAAATDAKNLAESAATRAETAGDAAETAAGRAEAAASLAAGYSDSTNLLTKNLFGRLSAASLSAPYTCQTIMELEAAFMGFRVGIPNIHTAAVAGVRVCVALVNQAIPQAWLIDNAPTTEWLDVTFNGATSVTLPAQLGAERPSFTWSDPIELQSIPRIDAGKVRPLVMVRIEIPQGGYRSQPINGISSWRLDGSPRYFKAATQDVLGVTNKAAYTNTLNTEVGVVVPAIQYMTEKSGKQLLISGDSTVEGVGGTPICYAAAQRVAYEASTPENPVEYFNAALHAQIPRLYHQRVADLADVVLPTNVVYSPYSSNDAAVGGLDQNAIRRLKTALGNVLAACRKANCRPEIVLLEGLPNTTAYRNYGAGDARRTELNAWLATITGARVATGYADAVSGATVDGQVQLDSNYTADGVHPNAAGYAALADALRPFISLGAGA